MAISKVVYGATTLVDLTGDTVAADKTLQGYTGHDATGAPFTGTLVEGQKPRIIVTAPTGSTVTATKGSITLNATEQSGTWTFELPEFGTWTVTASNIYGESATDTIVVEQDNIVALNYSPTASLTPISGVTYTEGIASLDPATLSLYAEAISNNSGITNTTSEVYIDYGASHFKFSIGDSVNISVNSADYPFIILGFNHDDLTTATAYGEATVTGKAGITLQMLNCLSTKDNMNDSNTTTGGWNGCRFRTRDIQTIKSTMLSAWQDEIKTVNKLASAGNRNSTIVTSEDTLFLLSQIEVFGFVGSSANGEGNQYAWYVAGNSARKTVASINSWWWTRSANMYTAAFFEGVDVDGTRCSGGNAYSSKFGRSLAFCI